MKDYELIAQELSGLGELVHALGERVGGLEELLGSLEKRLAEVERVDDRLEDAALTTARALQDISDHWDAVYEAMRRRETSQEAPER